MHELTVFLDLDDTLVDTYGLLITPLERAAAKTVCRMQGRPFKDDDLLGLLLELRRRNPSQLQHELSRAYPADADDIIGARKELFNDFDISDLKIGADVVGMLRELSQFYVLVLLTEGSYRIQSAKIDHLGIRHLFSKIIIVSNSGGETKERAISRYLQQKKVTPGSTVVVGNRLDREIAVGRRLGAKTIWVRSGEGSEYTGKIECDNVVENITELPAALKALFGES
jgi:FMN phosphatase YigB (HAD superfamily)